MKILVVCQYYYPEQFRINDICEQLVLSGHSVTVLTGLPNYPSGQIPTEYRWGKKRTEIVNGVKVIRVFVIGRKGGVARLALNYMSYALSASLKAVFIDSDFDIIFIYQLSPVFMAFPGIVAKKRMQRPLYMYCCDIWPESLKNLIPREDSIIYGLAKRISNYLYSRCDAITVTTNRFIHYFSQEHSIPVEKLSYFPQHAEDIYAEMDFSTPVNETVDFVFMGNIGMAQDIECILDATEEIKYLPGFKVHFVGDGSYLEHSRKMVELKDLKDIVVFHGRHSLEEMENFYRLADACLLTLKADTLIGYTVPSKLQGYMAAGKPVIGAIDGGAKEIIRESGCGVCVDAGDFHALAKVMKDFVENHGLYSECGTRGREYFQRNFTKDIFMDSLIEELERLVRGSQHV